MALIGGLMNICTAIKAYERLRDKSAVLNENARIALAAAALMAPDDKDVDEVCRWVLTRIDTEAPMPLCALAGKR
jgi:hypothetical protein